MIVETILNSDDEIAQSVASVMRLRRNLGKLASCPDPYLLIDVEKQVWMVRLTVMGLAKHPPEARNLPMGMVAYAITPRGRRVLDSARRFRKAMLAEERAKDKQKGTTRGTKHDWDRL